MNLQDFLNQFENVKISDVHKIGKKYYQQSKSISEFVDSLQEYPHGAGLFLGEEVKNMFIPSPSLLELIGEQTTRKIVLNEKSAWLFVCGRDVFKDGILEDVFEKGYVLALNEHKEILGVVEKKGKDYTNIYDIGFLLRREQKKGRK